MWDGRVDPAAIAGRDRAPERGAAALIDEANDGVAIDGRRDGLAKFHIATPFLFAGEVRGGSFAEVVQVEEEEVVFETRTGIGHGVATLLARKDGEVFRAQAGNEVCFARLEAQDLGVGTGDEEKDEFI